MIETAFLVLRECAELMLVIWAAQTCLVGVQRQDLRKYLWAGTAAGVALGLGLVAVLALRQWGVRTEAVMNIALGLGVLFMACAMLSSRADIEGHVAGWFHDALDQPAAPALVAGFAALAAVREAAEVGVFLHAAVPHQGVAGVWAGAALGLAAAGMVALAFRTLHARVPLLALFQLSSLLLCLIAIQLTLESVGRLLASYPALADSPLAALLSPEGKAFGYLCALLMVPPALAVIRRWWGQTGNR